MLFKTVESLIRDSTGRKQMGINAYETIRDVWNAENAANNLCRLIDRLTGLTLDESARETSAERNAAAAKEDALKFAPCKPAPVISERKMFRYLTENGK